KMLHVSAEYLSAGANRHPSVADWDSSGLLAFGTDNNIALWKPDGDEGSRGVTDILCGHTDIVNAVKFLPTIPSILLSGSVDKKIIVWKKDDSAIGNYTLAQTLTDHTSSINCIAVSKKSPNIFASGSADARVNIWSIDDNATATLKQIIEIVPRFFPLALDLISIAESAGSYILAVAGTKNIIQLYVLDLEKSTDFHLQLTLSSHEGWIRSLEFTKENLSSCSDILLSSASQDKYIRLWRISQEKISTEAKDFSDKSTSVISSGKLLSNKIHRFKAESHNYYVTLEALLSGHEDWIYSAKWNTSGNKVRLLSASADNSLAIWEPDPSTGIFTITTRLGEISSEKGSTTATGSTGGFWTGLWSPSGKFVTCLGRTGSWRLWKQEAEKDRWSQLIGISGHTRSVNGISWSKNGDFLLSTSSDQTTRLHAKWVHADHNSWHEMSRPQIHGYDLICIDWLGNSRFVSGAEEKLLRVFARPKAVRSLLGNICGLSITDDEEYAPEAANMPLLGLSNKKIEDTTSESQNEETKDRGESCTNDRLEITKLNLHHPPLEDQLSKFTLWPEVEKLYGHGNEISALAVSHDGSIIATACKASSIEHAVIRIFETKNWLEIKPPLTVHTLTVTKLKFSSDDLYLLSVGRDRQWAIFKRNETVNQTYTLLEANEQAHLRMILDATWAPGENRAFATAGRDKQVKLWAQEMEEPKLFNCKITLPDKSPVTAAHFSDTVSEDGFLHLATGNELGNIRIYYLNINKLSVNEIAVYSAGSFLHPSRRINQLLWRPNNNDRPERTIHLAVAGDDCSVRIFSMKQDL
ncbi:hypothetical protein Golomagni_00515, partial [Golovinomyces magnicellulatus]